MRHFRQFFQLFVILSSLSCQKESAVTECLNDVSSYIEVKPDSALLVLQSITADHLTTRRSKAYHSLLTSIALDKNYIDLKNDSIIRPAIDYYKCHGSPDERMKTQYYWGRILSNAGDYEAAMQSFVAAERYVPEVTDKVAIGRLYKAKSVILSNQFDLNNALKNQLLAANYYLDGKNLSLYVSSLLDISNIYLKLNLSDSASFYLERCLADYWEIMSTRQKGRYYCNKLAILKSVDQVATSRLIDEYLSVCDETIVNWIVIADIYAYLGQSELAKQALLSHGRLHSDNYESPAYFAVEAEVYRLLGDFKTALEAYCEYVRLTEEMDMEVFKSEVKFIEERCESELIYLKEKQRRTVLSFFVIAILALTTLFLYKVHKIVLQKQSQLNNLSNEVRHLRNIIKNEYLDKNTRKLINERLEILNKFISANISQSFGREAREGLNTLMEDRDMFLESTRVSFMLAHPEFLAYLKEHSLTEWEISCCCLYCIGLNGSEISFYLRRKAIYNVSGVIRKKLGMEKRTTNIEIYLRQKMSEFDL